MSSVYFSKRIYQQQQKKNMRGTEGVHDSDERVWGSDMKSHDVSFNNNNIKYIKTRGETR